MATRVEEAYGERDQRIDASGAVTEIEVPYIVFGAGDEDEALAAARVTAAARTVSGMALESVEMTERVNDGTWRVKAVYARSGNGSGGEEDDGDGGVAFSFDTGGATMHLNQSIRTVSRTPNNAPDFKGAIEVDNEGNVNGVDVTMPVFNFTETVTKAPTFVTADYRKSVAALTGSVNSASFRGFDAGEVLFLGASGAKRSADADAPWEITFRFAVSPNRRGLKVGDLTVNAKLGWDYLWVRYASKAAAGGTVRTPVAAYVEQVYPDGDFSKLGIGS